MTSKTQPCGRERSLGNPYEIWNSFDGEWEWHVYKKKGESISTEIWYCGVKSPNTSSSWEYSSVYANSITKRAFRSFIDPQIDFFSGVRPEFVRTDIMLPCVEQTKTVLTPETFSFLCNYFTENGMSFHTPDTYGNLVLLFSVEIDLCPIVLNSQWGFSYSKDHSNELSIQLVVYDQPDDPLNIPFVFNTQTQRHPSEMVRFIEQEILTVYILTIQSGGLCYFDARSIQIPENFKQELTTDIREMLSQTN